MNDKGKLLKNIAFMTVSEISSKFVVFLTTAYLARTLNPDGMGDLAFINSFYAFFLIAVTFGFSTIGFREIAKQPSRLKTFVDTYVSLRAIIASCSFALLVLISLLMDVSDEVKILCIVQGSALLWNAFLLDWVFQGLERMEITSLRQIITALATLGLSVLLVRGRDDLAYAVIINIVLVFINTVWIFALHLKENAKFNFKIDKDLLRETMPAVLPLGIVAIAITIQSSVSNLFLKAYANSEDVGFFYAAYRFSTLTAVLPVAFQNSFFPVLTRETDRSGRASIVKSYFKMNMIFCYMVVAVIFTFSNWFSVFVFGIDYATIGDLTKLLMVIACFSLLNVMLNSCLIAWGKEKKCMQAMILSSVVNIVAQFFLTSQYGAFGSAYSLFISEALMSAILLINYLKLSDFSVFLSSVKYFIYIAIACSAGYFSGAALGQPIAGIAVAGLVYSGIIFGAKEISIKELLSYVRRRGAGNIEA